MDTSFSAGVFTYTDSPGSTIFSSTSSTWNNVSFSARPPSYCYPRRIDNIQIGFQITHTDRKFIIMRLHITDLSNPTVLVPSQIIGSSLQDYGTPSDLLYLSTRDPTPTQFIPQTSGGNQVSGTYLPINQGNLSQFNNFWN